MAFVNEEVDGKWKTTDRDRNIVLRKLSGPERDTAEYRFELMIDGEEIRFAGKSGMKIHGQPKVGERRQYDMNWHIFRLYIPDHLQSKKSEILDIIHDALEAWGDNYNKERAHSVSVKFDPVILKDDVGNWGIVSRFKNE